MKTDRSRWVMIVLVFLATMINYLDRQALSVVAPRLREELGLSNTDYGRIIFAFMLAYTIMNGASGVLIDRIGTKAGYALFMLWWSVATLLHPFATGVWSFGICRFLLGMGEAGNWPAGVKVVAEWFPERERALASGIFNSGSAIGAIVSPPLIVWIMLRYGWQASFLFVGVTGLFWLTLWWRIYRTPDDTASGPGIPAPRTWGALELLKTSFVQRFTLAKIFLDPTWYFYIFWFPEYLRRVHKFEYAAIGAYGWIPFAVAGVGNLLGGWTSSRLSHIGLAVMAARKVAVAVFAALMTAAIPAVFVHDPRWTIALVSAAMMGYTGCQANILAMPADAFPSTVVASIYGISGVGAGFGGMLFSLLTGWTVDHFSYVPVFVGFGIAPIVAAAILSTIGKGKVRCPAAGSSA